MGIDDVLMPSPKIPEGFYWCCYTKEFGGDKAPLFVAHRFAGSWYSPGASHPEDEKNIVVLSQRIEPPVEAEPIPKAALHRVVNNASSRYKGGRARDLGRQRRA